MNWSGKLALNQSRLARMRLSKTSHMPASLTSLPRPRAWAAAPEQRPPQPSMPMRISCLPCGVRRAGQRQAAHRRRAGRGRGLQEVCAAKSWGRALESDMVTSFVEWPAVGG